MAYEIWGLESCGFGRQIRIKAVGSGASQSGAAVL